MLALSDNLLQGAHIGTRIRRVRTHAASHADARGHGGNCKAKFVGESFPGRMSRGDPTTTSGQGTYRSATSSFPSHPLRGRAWHCAWSGWWANHLLLLLLLFSLLQRIPNEKKLFRRMDGRAGRRAVSRAGSDPRGFSLGKVKFRGGPLQPLHPGGLRASFRDGLVCTFRTRPQSSAPCPRQRCRLRGVREPSCRLPRWAHFLRSPRPPTGSAGGSGLCTNQPDGICFPALQGPSAAHGRPDDPPSKGPGPGYRAPVPAKGTTTSAKSAPCKPRSTPQIRGCPDPPEEETWWVSCF